MVSDSKSLFRSILNIWGKPAENFALLTNRGHEIFVGRPRSVRGKYEEAVLKGSRLLAALPTAKVLATEASRGSAKAPTPGARCWRFWWLID
jgi:hypothetical protein